MGVMDRERPAANILIGPWYGEALIVASAGQNIGALQVGGTARISQAPFFVVVCDYALLGDEVFAAGAYLSKDPLQIGTIAGGDIGKIICILLVAIGMICASTGMLKQFVDALFMSI